MTQAILLPVAVLVAWSLIMWIWLYATRIPAMQEAKINPQSVKHPGSEPMNSLPAGVRQVADNYNHLMEQPTIFYAIVLTLALTGEASAIDVWLAWGYVAMRVIHSLWHALKNVVMIRFFIFVAGSLFLFPLTGRALYILMTG